MFSVYQKTLILALTMTLTGQIRLFCPPQNNPYSLDLSESENFLLSHLEHSQDLDVLDQDDSDKSDSSSLFPASASSISSETVWSLSVHNFLENNHLALAQLPQIDQTKYKIMEIIYSNQIENCSVEDLLLLCVFLNLILESFATNPAYNQQTDLMKLSVNLRQQLQAIIQSHHLSEYSQRAPDVLCKHLGSNC